MPETPDDLDVVQVIKQEWVSLGGGSTSPYSVPIEPLEDGVEVGAVFVVESGRRNKALAIWSDNGDLRIRDVANPGVGNKGFTLTELLASSGITEAQHDAFDKLLHDLDESFDGVPTFDADGIITGVVVKDQSGTPDIRTFDQLTSDSDGLISGYRVRQYDGAGAVVQTLTGTVTNTNSIPVKSKVDKT